MIFQSTRPSHQDLDFSLRRHLEDLGETQELWDGWSTPSAQGGESTWNDAWNEEDDDDVDDDDYYYYCYYYHYYYLLLPHDSCGYECVYGFYCYCYDCFVVLFLLLLVLVSFLLNSY